MMLCEDQAFGLSCSVRFKGIVGQVGRGQDVPYPQSWPRPHGGCTGPVPALVQRGKVPSLGPDEFQAPHLTTRSCPGLLGASLWERAGLGEQDAGKRPNLWGGVPPGVGSSWGLVCRTTDVWSDQRPSLLVHGFWNAGITTRETQLTLAYHLPQPQWPLRSLLNLKAMMNLCFVTISDKALPWIQGPSREQSGDAVVYGGGVGLSVDTITLFYPWGL